MEPYTGPPQSIPGLDGLQNARAVGDDYQLQPFETFRNEGGQRYAQSVLTNPNEAPQGAPQQPPSGIGGAPQNPYQPQAPVDSYQSMTGQPYPGQQQQQGIGGVPHEFLSLIQMLGGNAGWGMQQQQQPYGGAGYGQANNVPNVYGGGIGYQGGPGGWGQQQQQRPQPRSMSAYPQETNRLSRPSGIGSPNAYQPTLSGGIQRGGYTFWRGGRV